MSPTKAVTSHWVPTVTTRSRSGVRNGPPMLSVPADCAPYTLIERRARLETEQLGSAGGVERASGLARMQDVSQWISPSTPTGSGRPDGAVVRPAVTKSGTCVSDDLDLGSA
jgi:hypothetical protein